MKFFLLRLLRDFTNPTMYAIANDLTSSTLGHYYLLFDEEKVENQKGAVKSFVLDENGIPLTPTYVDVEDQDFVYFPITIGQYGLSIYHTYLKTKSEYDIKRFFNTLKWFEDNSVEDSDIGIYWLTKVSLPQYKNPGPWKSAFVQGRGISLFTRAFQHTHDEKYRSLVKKALLPLTKEVKDGGVTRMTQWGPFYEEYTANEPTLVLNGFMFSLFGIYDCVRIFPEIGLAKELFWDGVETLKNCLPDYDLGYWSRYNHYHNYGDDLIDPATISYHRLHITQLNIFHRITEWDIFKHYSSKWDSYDNLMNKFRTYTLKIKVLKALKRF